MPFEISHAAIDAFPVAVWSKIQSKVWGCAAGDALLEGARAGWRPLRNAVAGYLHAVRGIPCLLEQVLIVSSTRAAIDLSVRVLGRAGDQVWMEDPGYPWAREAFHGHGLSTVALPVSSEGIDVAAGIELAGEARLAYLTPACQFPTCSALTPARRAAILAWAASHDSYILEDDWDFNAVFDGRQPLDALAATQSDRVIFIHSFNRLLFPGLRIAAIVVPPHLVTDFLEARRTIDSFPNVANEMALTEFIEQGLLSAHLRKCRALFAERRATLHSCIERYLGRWLRVDKGRPGLHCLAWTRGRASRLASMARTGGVACTATSDFTIETDQFPDALLLGFATFPCEVIEDASRRLAEVFDDTLDAGDIWRGAGVS